MKSRKLLTTWLAFSGVLLLLILASCKDNYDFAYDGISNNVEISPGVGLHVGTATLKLSDLVKEEEGVFEFAGDDSIITIKYADSSLFNMAIADVYDMPEIEGIEGQSFDIADIKLDDISAERKVEVTDLAAGTGLPTYSGTGPFPPVSNVPGGEYDYAEFDQFEVVTFSSGKFTVTVTNDLPFPINNLTLDLINDNGVLSGSAVFPSIAARTSEQQVVDMAGKTMTKNVSARLSSFSTPGAAVVDYGDPNVALYFNVATTEELIVETATAKIPEQIIEDFTDVSLSSEDQDVDLKELKLKTGEVNFVLNSAFDAPIALNVKLPFTKDENNNVVEYDFSFDGSGQQTRILDLANTITDLTKGGTASNVFAVEYKATVGGTDQLITFSTPAAISIDATFDNVDFEYITGQFGNLEPYLIESDSFELAGNFFDQLDGELKLTSPKMSLVIDNSFGIGVDINLDITGHKGSEAVNLEFKDNPIKVDAATTPGQSEKTVIPLDKEYTNGTIVDLIAMLPDYIAYGGNAKVQSTTGTDYGYVSSSSAINVGLFVDMPLEISINNLVYMDTIDFDGSGTNWQDVVNAELGLKTNNEFPFDLVLEIDLLGENYLPLGKLEFQNQEGGLQLISAAVKNSDGSYTPTNGELSVRLTADEFARFPDTKYMKLRAMISTFGANDGIGVVLKANSALTIDLTMALQMNSSSN